MQATPSLLPHLWEKHWKIDFPKPTERAASRYIEFTEHGSIESQKGVGMKLQPKWIEAYEAVMPEILFGFVRQVDTLSKKLTDAALLKLNVPAGKSIAGWKHAVLLYLIEHMEAEYEKVIDCAEEIERVRGVLGLERGNSPHSQRSAKFLKELQCLAGDSWYAALWSCWGKVIMLRLMRRISTDASILSLSTTDRSLRQNHLNDLREGAVLDVHCSGGGVEVFTDPLLLDLDPYRHSAVFRDRKRIFANQPISIKITSNRNPPN